jgi:peptide/nickel transport system substrate-binding protein
VGKRLDPERAVDLEIIEGTGIDRAMAARGREVMHQETRSKLNLRVSRRGVLRGGALSVLGVGLAGCTPPSSAPTAGAVTSVAGPAPTTGAAIPSPATAAVRPKYGGTLKTMATFAERNLDPHAANGAIIIGSALCYNQLLTYKWGKDIPPLQYIPGPDLAESWTQPDELTYLFKLRPNVKWHNIAPVNGRVLMAEDVVYSFQRVRDLKAFASRLSGISKFEAPDKSTVRLALDKPNADLLSSLCDWNLKIVAREAVELNGNLEAPPVIGTGPWLFEKWIPNEAVFARRNPEYFLPGLPFADGLESYRSTDPAKLSDSFRTGTVNVLGPGLVADNGEALLKALPRTQVLWIPQDRAPVEMGLRTTAEPFTDLRVRQAIFKAIDRKAILSSVFLGRAVLFSGIMVPSFDWNLAQAELSQLTARDVEGSRRLLKEAGKESGFDLEVLVPTYLNGSLVTTGELVQANLKDLGIRVTLRPLDSVTLAQRQNSGNFQAYISAVGLSTTNATLYSRVYTGGAQNLLKYTNPALDKLIDQQAGLSRDPDARKKILADIQRIVISDAAYISLGMYEQPTVAYPEIRDFYPPTTISFHTDFWSTLWFDT